MSAWWEMMCDDGHGWAVFIEDDSQEPDAQQLMCPQDGEPAVTAARLPVADRVKISLIPAAWERDGRVGREDEYFLEIRSIADDSLALRTSTTLDWETAVKRGAMFRGISPELAQKRWSRMFPQP